MSSTAPASTAHPGTAPGRVGFVLRLAGAVDPVRRAARYARRRPVTVFWLLVYFAAPALAPSARSLLVAAVLVAVLVVRLRLAGLISSADVRHPR